MKTKIDKINHALDHYLQGNSHLMQAMRYAVLDGGKRMRPLLVLTTAESLGTDIDLALAPACAIEMLHAYSLIHDDLPAMDNDDFRRGRPSTHKAFDEATAILAGDALQARAFEILSNAENLSAACRLDLMRLLSQASGASGLCLGQDLDLSQKPANIEELKTIHHLKTGALIQCAILMGACVANANRNLIGKLSELGETIGLAFQIQDDVIDHEQDKKQAHDEMSYVNFIGKNEAEKTVQQLFQHAKNVLHSSQLIPSTLTDFIQLIANRGE